MATTISSMRVFAGTLLERPPGPKYTAELRYAELAPQAPMPKPATLAKWRQRLPAELQIALRAPEPCWRSQAGPMRMGDELRASLDWLVAAADALQASAVVVATGAALTTGAHDRKLLREYFEELPRVEGRALVWRPTGLWEAAELQRFADELSVVAGVDPIDDPIPSSPLVYATLVAEGLRRSFSQAQLMEVLDKLRASEPGRVFVTIDSAQSFREAKLLQALADGKA